MGNIFSHPFRDATLRLRDIHEKSTTITTFTPAAMINYLGASGGRRGEHGLENKSLGGGIIGQELVEGSLVKTGEGLYKVDGAGGDRLDGGDGSLDLLEEGVCLEGREGF